MAGGRFPPTLAGTASPLLSKLMIQPAPRPSVCGSSWKEWRSGAKKTHWAQHSKAHGPRRVVGDVKTALNGKRSANSQSSVRSRML